MAESTQETGEFFDNETGETAIAYSKRFSTDAETGEPEMEQRVVKRKFQIPVQYLQPRHETRGSRTKSRRKNFRERKNQSHWYSGKSGHAAKEHVGPIVFMLPTLLIFPGWMSILCVLGEACMHIWSHERNRRKKNTDIEYRSPLHLMSAQFCVHCRSQRWMEKISEIQEKRTLRRKIIHPNVFRTRVVQ